MTLFIHLLAHSQRLDFTTYEASQNATSLSIDGARCLYICIEKFIVYWVDKDQFLS